MAMDDQALNPFHEALNWQGQKTPEWMEKVVGRGNIKETGDTNVGGLGKLPEGDGIFVLSNGLLPVNRQRHEAREPKGELPLRDLHSRLD